MTQQGVPPISRSDLRDHATQDRIDRLWERIDANLVGDEPTGSPSRLMVGVLAAVVASLAGGVLIGKLIWDQPSPSEVSAAPTVVVDSEEPVSVFAAGTQVRSYPLPGGGQMLLSPGTMIEVVRQEGNRLELRLVQGEATIDTDTSSRQQVALIAGEAALSTGAGGIVHVRRNEHDLDIRVADGFVSVRSPDGSHKLTKGDSIRSVPLHARPTARLVSPAPEASAHIDTPRDREPVAFVEPSSPAPAVPDWQARSRTGDTQDALRLLRAQTGGIDGTIQSATDVDVLWEIHDVAIRSDSAAAHRALIRVAEAFPGDASAQLAAYKLGNYYRRAGQHEQANKWFALAAQSPEGVFAEDALCKQFRTAPNEVEAIRFAQEYLVKYPNGRCKLDAERLIAGESSEEGDESVLEPEEDPESVDVR